MLLGLSVPVVNLSTVRRIDGMYCRCLVSAMHSKSEVTQTPKVGKDDMHIASKHTAVMVNEDDIRSLRALAAAFNSNPVYTSMTIIVPMQSKR